MEPPKAKQQPFYFQVVLIVGFVFIVLMLSALARSIYRDLFQVGRYIENSVTLINEQKVQLSNKPAELAYAQTSRYQEKIAKELFGRKVPGEEVIILSGEAQDFVGLMPSITEKRENGYELLTGFQKWRRYIFGI